MFLLFLITSMICYCNCVTKLCVSYFACALMLQEKTCKELCLLSESLRKLCLLSASLRSHSKVHNVHSRIFVKSPSRIFVTLVHIFSFKIDSKYSLLEILWKFPLCKILILQLISWSVSFVERRSFRSVFSDSPETLWTLCVSTKVSTSGN